MKFDLSSINQSFEEFKETVEKNNKADSRFWKIDKKQPKKYKIRFLPYINKDGKWKFFIQRYIHYLNSTVNGEMKFKSVLCPTSIGEKCHICEKVSELYSSAFEVDHDAARQRGKKLECLANILVLSDPLNPENEGKVFIFKFGRMLRDKLLLAMGLQNEDELDEDEEKVNVFDPINGWDFKLVVSRKGDFPDYSQSEFIKKRKPLFGGDEEKIREILEQTYDLDEFLDPELYPDYNETKVIYKSMFGKIDDAENSNKEKIEDEIEDDVPDEEIIDETEDVTDIEDDDEDLDDLFDE